jgi:hypothetical protein
VPGRVATIARNGAPLIVWQSVQLQMVVIFGIGFGLEPHVAAVTASINFHVVSLEFRK